MRNPADLVQQQHVCHYEIHHILVAADCEVCSSEAQTGASLVLMTVPVLLRLSESHWLSVMIQV